MFLFYTFSIIVRFNTNKGTKSRTYHSKDDYISTYLNVVRFSCA
uniref:Uncharacterized protein n=1 Tax=Arundo donax TaxID=35708 RepID=A0A0A8YCK0_ARUDO